MRARMLMAVAVLGGAAALTRADDKPLERAELDKRIVTAVYEAAAMGTEMFNAPKSNYDGCVGLYKGTLMAVVPLLDHRPKLQADTKTRLQQAAKMDKPTDAAFELRAALDEIQNTIAPPKDKEMKDKEPKDKGKEPKDKPTTLWDRLGGEKGVKALVATSVLVAADDPKVPFLLRDKKVDLTKFQQAMVALVSASAEGPHKFSAIEMKAALGGVVVTGAEFDALKAVMADQLKKAMVADADADAVAKAVEGARGDIVEKN